MPYLYPLQVRESGVQGKGLFALEDIPKDVIYWVFQTENHCPVKGYEVSENRVYTKEEFEAKGEEELKKIFHGGLYFAQGDVFIEFNDGSQFMNHSFTPNSQIVYPSSKDVRELKSCTTKEIKKGQEICESYTNYFSGKSEWVTAMMEKHDPQRKKFQWSINGHLQGESENIRQLNENN